MRHFQTDPEMLGKNFSEAFADLLDPADKLKIFTKDGNVSIVSRDLVRFFSPLVNSILKDAPCCTDNMIFIPDVSKASVDHILSIISSGITEFNAMSIKHIQEVQETAKMLEIDLTNMDYVEKGKMVVSDFAKAREEEMPAPQRRAENNEMFLQFKTERPASNDNIEALLEADSSTVDGQRATLIKEEPLDQNVEVPKSVEKTAEKSKKDFPANYHPLLAPTPPSESESESSKSSSRSPKYEEYLHRVKGSKRGTKRSISEETMAALAKMMKDPKRKPTMEEMEELLSRTKSFKDHVAAPEERRKESPRSPDGRSDNGKSRSPSKDRRARTVHRRSVSPERRTVEQKSFSGYPGSGAAHPSPAHFPYMQTQHGQPQYSQYQNHPQPQIQYMVQPDGAVQAYVPGTVPVQFPYSTVQGMDHVQYNMVQAPPSTVRYQVRSPSPVHRRSPLDSSSSSELSRYYSKVGKKSERTMAEKKASLLTMTAEEKRHMTCLDWNSGLCPRLDAGKLCVFGGSKKKHICSKIIKSSRFGGSKVCWGKHREGEHKDEERRRGGWS